MKGRWCGALLVPLVLMGSAAGQGFGALERNEAERLLGEKGVAGTPGTPGRDAVPGTEQCTTETVSGNFEKRTASWSTAFQWATDNGHSDVPASGEWSQWDAGGCLSEPANFSWGSAFCDTDWTDHGTTGAGETSNTWTFSCQLAGGRGPQCSTSGATRQTCTTVGGTPAVPAVPGTAGSGQTGLYELAYLVPVGLAVCLSTAIGFAAYAFVRRFLHLASGTGDAAGDVPEAAIGDGYWSGDAGSGDDEFDPTSDDGELYDYGMEYDGEFSREPSRSSSAKQYVPEHEGGSDWEREFREDWR